MQELPRKKRKAYEKVQKSLLYLRKMAKPEYLSYAAPDSNSLQFYLDQLEKSLLNIEILDDRAILNIYRRVALLEQLFTLLDICDKSKVLAARSGGQNVIKIREIEAMIPPIIERLKNASMEI